MKFSEELNKLFHIDRELDQKRLSIFSKEVIELTRKKNELFKSLYESDKYISKKISFKYFYLRLNLLTNEFYESNKSFNETDVNKFISDIKNLKMLELKVLRSLKGATLKKSNDIYKLGNFEIYHFQTHKEYLQSLSKMDPSILWYGQNNEYLIGIDVSAREAETAAEIADAYFYHFEMCYYFIKATKDENHEIGILHYSPLNPTEQYVLSIETGFRNSGSTGSFRSIDIDNEYFVDKDNGYDKMWQLISKTNLNEYEGKILRAIIWAGKSIYENDIVDSFVQVAISLEILLTFKQKDQLITPSIVHQLSETAAFIIANSYEDRIKIEKDIKELYTIRSNIVHLGNRHIKINDYYKLFFYVKDIIIKLLTFDKYNKIQSLTELHKLIKKVKYS